MSALASVLVLGFFLGMRHATDADHVIAVATIVSRERSVGVAGLLGVLWGLGHTLTIVLVGGAIILFGVVIPPRVGLSMELSVGAMLVLLGLLNLRDLGRWARDTLAPAPGAVHSHLHRHGEYVHAHPHRHDPDAHGHAEADTPLGRLLRPVAVGVVHGLAGSAAVALLVLPVIPEPLWGLAYLGVFGAGTVAGMVLVTVALGLPFAWTAGRFARVQRSLRLAAGLLSLGFGLYLVWEIGVGQGLFRGGPPSG